MLFLLAFEAFSLSGIVPARELPPAHTIALTFGAELGRPEFWAALGMTLQQTGAGLLFGTLIAVPLGLVIGSNELVWRALRPTVEFLRPIPSVALLPLVVLVWGSGTQSAVLVTTLGVIWPMLIHAVYGVRDVDPRLRVTARAYHLGRVRTVALVVVPSAVPLLLTGLRIASSVALIIAVATELVIGSPGLGKLMLDAQNALATSRVYALVVAAGLLGLFLHLVFSLVERRAAPWRAKGDER